jgi:hypothetical protein
MSNSESATAVEKAARNIRRQFNIRNFDRDDDNGWQADIDDARAAIEALREPSDEIIEAMQLASWMGPRDEEYRKMWVAAIEVAIKSSGVGADGTKSGYKSDLHPGYVPPGGDA